MKPFSQLSCLSCEQMHEWEQLELKTYREKLFNSLKLASKRVARDLLKSQALCNTLIFAGPGGNGADAWAISSLLKEAGVDPLVVYVPSKSDVCAEMQLRALKNGVRNIQLKDFFKSKPQQSDCRADNSLCVFSSYLQTPDIDPYILFYLKELKTHVSRVILVTNTINLAQASIDSLALLGVEHQQTINQGYDFGMWKRALEKEDLESIDFLLLANDSCLPLCGLSETMNRFHQSQAAYVGLTESLEHDYHLQSYFLLFRPSAIAALKTFFQDPIPDKQSEVIQKCELGLTRHMMNNGIPTEALYPVELGEYNPSYFNLDQLLQSGFPFIKKKLFWDYHPSILERLHFIRNNFTVKDWPNLIALPYKHSFQTEGLPSLEQKPAHELGWDLIIDGFLGINAHRPLEENMSGIIEWANQRKALKVALDCPTGWHKPSEGLFQADITYCFHTVKKELLQSNLREACGDFRIIDVGFTDPKQGPQIFMDNPLDHLPEAKATWHKYKRGSVFLAVGSEIFKGSSRLAEDELWKRRSTDGPLTGMVYTLCPPSHPQSIQWDLSKPKSEHSSLVIGSGMDALNPCLPKAFELATEFNSVIIDAGALDYLQKNEHAWSLLPSEHTLLTPHEGEARRLLSLPKEASFENLVEKAQLFAKQKKCWILLKSYVSHLLGPNQEHWIEPFGGPHLAVAGAGDRLSALIGALSLHMSLEKATLVACRLQTVEKN